ncbi:MAG: hypothetical protein HBSAPP03_11320 [Phycisphaerae bacterium]|nr:MAG: hypothetical protein HBSAPP03_11320 [Phycisphaerae bacterium]
MPDHPSKPRRPFPVRTIQAVLGGRPIRVDSTVDEAMTPGLLRGLFHTLHLLLVGIRRTHLTRMAAALSYRTMFGIIPVIVVVAVALAAFTSVETQQSVIKNLLTYAGLDKIKVEGTPPPPVVDPGTPGVTAPPPGQAANGAESARLDEWINAKAVDIAGKIKKLPFNLIGLVAILTLIYAAISMLVEIEQSFNDIYNAPEGRGWMRRIIQYWTLLTFGPILLIASFAITHYLSDSAQSFADLGGESLKQHILAVVRFVSAAAVSTLLLLVIYGTVPNTRVHVAPAALGALVAGVLWELGKLGFTRYVEFATAPTSSTNFGSLYGAVAILPLFLIWVYLSWLIVLFGLQLAYSMQSYRQATARGLTRSVLAALGLIEDAHPAGRVRLLDPSAMLTVLAAVAERFRAGHPSDHNQVAQATGVDEQAVGEMLERLTAEGLLLRVQASGERLSTYALARPPETIPAGDVLRIAEELSGPRSGLSKPTRVTGLIGRARHEALAGKTLADLLPPTPTAPPESAPMPAGA